jgi:hypothetical protein
MRPSRSTGASLPASPLGRVHPSRASVSMAPGVRVDVRGGDERWHRVRREVCDPAGSGTLAELPLFIDDGSHHSVTVPGCAAAASLLTTHYVSLAESGAINSGRRELVGLKRNRVPRPDLADEHPTVIE